MGSSLRLKVAAGLLFGVLSVLGAAHAAAPTKEVRYICEPGQRLIVQRSAQTAAVQFIDKSYLLHRKASSIGEKYVSANAALIIDGPSAVFVAEDRLQLGTCTEANSTAFAR
ncbi:MAG TPA: hypothetical protein VFR92_05570 [Sphingomicrobium sp.]|jgi:membrane-bound inhibitor of C-type lysozyme|nr:hypothetical protein [Sphingomicrobium sp.]